MKKQIIVISCGPGLNKVKDEIKSANQKESIFTLEEREILSKFINKVRKELKINELE